MSQNNILVTGANGLLGRHFLELYSKKYKIYAVVRHTPEDPIQGVEYCVIDFSKDWSVDDLPKDIAAIYHLAQSENFRDFPEKVLDVFDVNISSTAKLLIIGQAPGSRVHKTGIPWNDPSGRQLRKWLNVTEEVFYNETKIALIPMGSSSTSSYHLKGAAILHKSPSTGKFE